MKIFLGIKHFEFIKSSCTLILPPYPFTKTVDKSRLPSDRFAKKSANTSSVYVHPNSPTYSITHPTQPSHSLIVLLIPPTGNE